MIRRIISILLLAWALGFVWFAAFLPQPLAEMRTDAIIVPTGGGGRIARGVEMLRTEQAPQMLVTGVDSEVTEDEFAIEFDVTADWMECCVSLGFAALDTRGNAVEAANWIRVNEIGSVRLVTTDWHMRRAALDLERQVPPSVAILRDAVPSRPRLPTLFVEYHKLLADYAWGWI